MRPVRRLYCHTALLSPTAGANQADLADMRLYSQPCRKSGGYGKHFLFCNARRNGRMGRRCVTFGLCSRRHLRRSQLLESSYALGDACQLRTNVFKRRAQLLEFELGDRVAHLCARFLYVDFCHNVSHSGISPCFFCGRSSRFACRYSSACATCRRVSAGSITASTKRRLAAT